MDSPEKQEQLLARVKQELQELPGSQTVQEQFKQCVTQEGLIRYLRARKGDVAVAAKLLLSTLKWRASMKLVQGQEPSQACKDHQADTLTIDEFPNEMQSGKMYVMGPDSNGNAILLTRKRSDGFKAGEYDHYMRHLALTLETCVRTMSQGQHQWVWILDMAGYSRANSPPLQVSLDTLKVLANHYPERLKYAFFVDAPSIFSWLWKALTPFIDPVTRNKVRFVRSVDLPSRALAGPVATTGSSTAVEQGSVPAADGPTADTPVAAVVVESLPATAVKVPDSQLQVKNEDVSLFLPYAPYYAAPYDEQAYRQLLSTVGWK